ncbi:unnamed protein product [Gadus morhua 'NCC']
MQRSSERGGCTDARRWSSYLEPGCVLHRRRTAAGSAMTSRLAALLMIILLGLHPTQPVKYPDRDWSPITAGPTHWEGNTSGYTEYRLARNPGELEWSR